MSQRLTILNRRGLNVRVQIDGPERSSKLVFIAHGQGGYLGQIHINAFAESFLANGYKVVRFDATHALGESDGELHDVTYDTYVSDLEDVIEWAKNQVWFVSPFALCGHSMGAQSTTWYAEYHPEEVSLLLPMAPVVNYELHASTMTADFLSDWQQKGYKEMASRSKPGVVKRIGWAVEESLKKFDILPLASKLQMPVFMIVGSEDEPCPPKHQRVFINLVGSQKKELIVLEGLEHSYRDAKTGEYGLGVERVQALMTDWLKSLE